MNLAILRSPATIAPGIPAKLNKRSAKLTDDPPASPIMTLSCWAAGFAD
jgi:hypothetical protein